MRFLMVSLPIVGAAFIKLFGTAGFLLFFVIRRNLRWRSPAPRCSFCRS
jgi:hypothetical protein